MSNDSLMALLDSGGVDLTGPTVVPAYSPMIDPTVTAAQDILATPYQPPESPELLGSGIIDTSQFYSPAPAVPDFNIPVTTPVSSSVSDGDGDSSSWDDIIAQSPEITLPEGFTFDFTNPFDSLTDIAVLAAKQAGQLGVNIADIFPDFNDLSDEEAAAMDAVEGPLQPDSPYGPQWVGWQAFAEELARSGSFTKAVEALSGPAYTGLAEGEIGSPYGWDWGNILTNPDYGFLGFTTPYDVVDEYGDPATLDPGGVVTDEYGNPVTTIDGSPLTYGDANVPISEGGAGFTSHELSQIADEVGYTEETDPALVGDDYSIGVDDSGDIGVSGGNSDSGDSGGGGCSACGSCDGSCSSCSCGCSA